MFCPRCGQQNSDDARYCRVCGENLKAIARAMTRHLPVVVASKIDEYLERSNERLRRDSILWNLMGLVFLTVGIWEPVMFVAAVIVFGFGAWNLMAYRRSLALESKPGKPTAPVVKSMYCPRCGESNETATKFCRKCGENLRIVVQAMTRRLPAFITNKLDRYIARKNEHILRDSIVSAIFGVLSLLFGVFISTASGINTNSLISFLPTLLAACLCFGISGWDMVVYRRSLSSASAVPELPAAIEPRELISNSRPRTPPPSVTESTTRRFDQPSEHSSPKE